MRQSLRASLGLLAMSLTVSLGQALQPPSLTPPDGFSFAEIGAWAGCSGENIRQIHDAALKKIAPKLKGLEDR